MIKEAIQYLVGLKENKIYEIGGDTPRGWSRGGGKMAWNPNRKYCRGCVYWKRISCTQVEYCNYLEETGRPRILICPPGKDCTVRETKRKVAPLATPQQHAFDFVKKRHRGVLDVQRAAELYDMKRSDGEIARELGVAVNTVCGWRKRTGRTPNLERGETRRRGREKSESTI